MIDCISMGDYFRKVRKERLLTIEDAAAIMCISPKALGNIELGKAEPRFNTAMIMLDVYAIPLQSVSGFYQRNTDISYAMKIMHYSPDHFARAL